MSLSLTVKPLDTAKILITHPGTGKPVGTFIMAGPEHPKTKARRRELDDLRQQKGYKHDLVAELIGTFVARTVGWEGVIDTETGEPVEFNPDLLPALYEQEWLRLQVLEGIGGNDLFFRS